MLRFPRVPDMQQAFPTLSLRTFLCITAMSAIHGYILLATHKHVPTATAEACETSTFPELGPLQQGTPPRSSAVRLLPIKSLLALVSFSELKTLESYRRSVSPHCCPHSPVEWHLGCF